MLRNRSGREAQSGPIQQQQKQYHANAAHAEDEHQVAAQGERARPHHHVGEERRIGQWNPRRGVHDDFVDQEQQADRRHQGRQRIGERNETESDHVDYAAERAARDGGK